MDEQGFDEAESYWVAKDAAAEKMPREQLEAWLDEFLANHNVCALATGAGDFVRCTPLEYNYVDGEIWIFSEGGKKFHALRRNANVCIAVFDGFTPGKLKSVELSGTAEFVEPFSATYNKLLEHKGIKVEALQKMGLKMPLLHILLAEADILDSSFKKSGFGARQHLDFA